jgi:hypothetical protein
MRVICGLLLQAVAAEVGVDLPGFYCSALAPQRSFCQERENLSFNDEARSLHLPRNTVPGLPG